MMHSFERSEKGIGGGTGRILPREMFLSLLDFEVKRSRRYQNFFCILVMKLNQISNHDNGTQQRSCYQKMAHLLEEELRESEIARNPQRQFDSRNPSVWGSCVWRKCPSAVR